MSGSLELILTRFGNWSGDEEKETYLDTLEEYIERCNKAAREGETLVPDAIYDTLMDFLRELNPNSVHLHQVWTEDDPNVPLDEDLDKHLVAYPMLSIQTIKHTADKPVKTFKANLPAGNVEVINSIKLNGHGVRTIWKDGYLIKGTSRGRSTNGKDLTEQMKIILGDYCEAFKDFGVVEMRGEAVLPFDRLDEARKFNSSIKSAFTGVASMIRASATPEETKLLDIVYYDIFTDTLDFDTLEDKYGLIQDSGFLIPEYFLSTVTRRTLEDDLVDIVNEMDIRTSDYDYYSDGVVVAINDIGLFEEFGAEDKFRLGNLALKIGRWKQDNYIGIVKEIKWENGKSKKTPVAVLEEGVLTATGSTVTNIPLYAPLYILLLEAYPGNPIHFKFGGEAGVVPITPDGRLVTDKAFEG